MKISFLASPGAAVPPNRTETGHSFIWNISYLFTYHIYLSYILCMYVCMYVWMDGWMYVCMCIIEGSLEVKLPTIWTDEKQSREEAERRERLEERRVEEKE